MPASGLRVFFKGKRSDALHRPFPGKTKEKSSEEKKRCRCLSFWILLFEWR